MGLFGPTPQDVLAQQQQDIANTAVGYGRMSPLQKADFGLFQGGAGLVNAAAGNTPQVQSAQQMQQDIQGLDLSTPEGVFAAAKKMSDTGHLDQAAQLVQLGQNLKLDQAKMNNLNEPSQGNLPPIVQAMQAYDKLTPEKKASTLGQQMKRYIDSMNADVDQSAIESYGKNILAGNATLRNVPVARRDEVSKWLASQPKGAYSPQALTALTQSSERITAPYKALPQYSLTANGLPYLQRIDAAIQTPGSVSDQDLLDSLTKLNTAGNAITDAQVKIITDGRSLKDTISVAKNKINNGGVLSDSQRQQIQKIAKAIYANYKKGYQPVYDKAVSNLRAAGIPEQLWTIPDLNNLSGLSSVDAGQSSNADVSLSEKTPVPQSRTFTDTTTQPKFLGFEK